MYYKQSYVNFLAIVKVLLAVSCIAAAVAAPVEQQVTSESNKDLETAEGHLGAYGGGLAHGGGYGGGYGHGFGHHGGEHDFEILMEITFNLLPQ